MGRFGSERVSGVKVRFTNRSKLALNTISVRGNLGGHFKAINILYSVLILIAAYDKEREKSMNTGNNKKALTMRFLNLLQFVKGYRSHQ